MRGGHPKRHIAIGAISIFFFLSLWHSAINCIDLEFDFPCSMRDVEIKSYIYYVYFLKCYVIFSCSPILNLVAQ